MARPYISTAVRQAVIERAQGRCEYCQSRADYATETFAVEHIIPINRGGTNELDNLALACSGCNNAKSDKIKADDFMSGTEVALYHPRRQKWLEHFEWSTDFQRVLGLTPTGRATIDALQMNRIGLVNLRRALYLLGEHPPGER